MKVKINTKGFFNLKDKLEDLPDESMKDAYKTYLENTPVRSGNARNKTKLDTRNNTINSNYDYASALNSGRSKQSPKGFTNPAIKKLQQVISQKIGKL
tara:strand:+ start:1435 stop:1728 length:294 start_codon:yes stop_codon:yes gene_type:complete